MKAIEYVIRGTEGAVERGNVPAAEQVTTVSLEAAQEISLNLRQIDLRGYQRNQDALVVELTDGRIIVIDNYFNDSGIANRLFISADGYLNEVAFVETADGGLYGQYGPTEQWGKWSPSDDLIFLGRTEVAGVGGDEDVSMLAAAGLLGAAPWAAGAAGALAVAGIAGSGGSDGPGGPAAPYVDNAAGTTQVGGDTTTPHAITVTGGGQPGDEVEVTIGGVTVPTVIGDDGTFEAVFTGDTFPDDGAYEAVVVVTDSTGVETELDGPGFEIDTVAPEVQITSGTAGAGDSYNADSFADGVTIEGTGEPGATVELTVEGVTRTTTVSDDGTWDVTWQAGVLPEGEYSSEITVVSRDPFGNSWTSSDTLVVDTVVEVTVNTATVEGDGVINAAEASDGVTLTGTAQPGSSVVVTMGSATTTVIADGNGAWAANFSAGQIPAGQYDADVTAVATDPAGNTATATGSLRVDTGVDPFTSDAVPGGADAVVNASEAASGIILSGQVEPGSQVSVAFGGMTQSAVVAANGTWTASFPASAITPGEYTGTMVATATDAAGNTSSITQDIVIDTVANTLSLDRPIEGDDMINGSEAADGVVLSGASVPGAVVEITMGGVTQTAVANGSGQWQTTFSAAAIPQGTYEATITATSTDAAGNSNAITDTVQVDTSVDDLSIAPVEQDNVVSGAEQQDGVIVSGTVEVGSSVAVTFGGATVDAAVDGAGNWTASFTAAQVATGEYNGDVTVLATDAAGNMASIVEGVRVDTFVNRLEFSANSTSTTLEGDGVINAVEAIDGINLGGQVEAGSSVSVNFNGTSVAATVDASGNWSVTIPASAIPAGSYDADITVTAVDAVGNSDSISQIVSVDTDAPDGPVIAAFTRDTAGLRSISTEGDNDGISLAAISETGQVSDVPSTDTYIQPFDETLHAFGSRVPDGSDLIVTNSDAAGNESATYLAMDDENPGSTVSLSAPALGNYQIEAVDLQFAEAATLSLTEAQIKDLAATDVDTLRVHGGADDTVQITGAVRTGSTSENGQTYDVYKAGDTTLIVDSDITLEEPPVI